MCNNARSFRSVYTTTNKLNHTPSYNRRYDSERVSKLEALHKSNRRVGNDAVRRFIQLIDLDSVNVGGQIFTCKKCEAPMDEYDFKQLGITAEQCGEAKRLRNVVIDAKVKGLLKDSSYIRDHHDVLTGAPGLKVRIFSQRFTQNAITALIKTVCSCVSKVRKVRAQTVGDDARSMKSIGKPEDGYMVRREYLIVSLWDMRRNMKGKSVDTRLDEYIQVIKWFIDNTACLCRDGEQCLIAMDTNEDASEFLCRKLRRKLANSEGRCDASYTLRALFRHVPGHLIPEMDAADLAVPVSNRTDGTDVNGVCDEGEDSSGSSNDKYGDDGQNGGWVAVKNGDFFTVQYQLESLKQWCSALWNQ